MSMVASRNARGENAHYSILGRHAGQNLRRPEDHPRAPSVVRHKFLYIVCCSKRTSESSLSVMDSLFRGNDGPEYM